ALVTDPEWPPRPDLSRGSAVGFLLPAAAALQAPPRYFHFWGKKQLLDLLAEKVDTKVLPGQDCALQAAPLQLGDKPQRDVPEEILQKPLCSPEEPVHDCIRKIEEEYSSRPDLTDQPLENPDMEMFAVGNSLMDRRLRKAGYAVATHQEVVEAEAFPPGTSVQKAELVALGRALHLGAKKKVTIYTASKYAFSVMHAHGAMWKKRSTNIRKEKN
uniref:RNase H type-1 domain-containing protein n=1 Tax=Phocoena sinus TaxID=42100 RepID=A0A8C9B1I1_PHOSS